MQLMMAGVALAVLAAVAMHDVGRPGRASAAGLVCLYLVGGSALTALALVSLASGALAAALVAGTAALGMAVGVQAARVERMGAARPLARVAPVSVEEDRRAA